MVLKNNPIPRLSYAKMLVFIFYTLFFVEESEKMGPVFEKFNKNGKKRGFFAATSKNIFSKFWKYRGKKRPQRGGGLGKK